MIIGKRKRNTRKKHPLVGKLICGGCKYPMIFKPLTEKNKNQRFECRMHAKLQIEDCCTNFNPTILEELVLQSLNKELLWMSELVSGKNHLLEAQEIDRKILDRREKTEELNEQLNQMEDEYYTEVDSVKNLIRYSHIESLTQGIVDTFIKAIYVYHNKRVEIEWTFTDIFRNLEGIQQL